jgi:hypothetical protein
MAENKNYIFEMAKNDSLIRVSLLFCSIMLLSLCDTNNKIYDHIQAMLTNKRLKQNDTPNQAVKYQQ